MTEREFRENCVSWKDGTVKGKEGRLCILYHPMPEWMRREYEKGEKCFSNYLNEYRVSFVPRYIRGKHTGELNWRKEGPETGFRTKEEAEAFLEREINS